MGEFSHVALFLMKVDPVRLVYVPTSMAVNHMSGLQIFCVFLLPINYVLCQMHFITVRTLVVRNDEFRSRNENRFRLQKAILHDIILICVLQLPFLILCRSEEKISFLLKCKCHRLEWINLLDHSDSCFGEFCIRFICLKLFYSDINFFGY